MKLKERFSELVSHYSKDETLINSLWNTIDMKYNEKHRAYHNLNHLKEIFSYYDSYIDKIESPDIMSFSIFYHDVIYNIWKKDNEEKSADFAIEKLSSILKEDHLQEIHQQIIATKTHEGFDSDTHFLLDFDLAILGQSETVYKTYTENIRKEYKLIPGFMYKKGRIKVLEHFITKPSIYKTDAFIALYEKQAKTNLSNELNFLKNGI